ncbi:hypothetical protein HII13_003754 [Brettanomyces bruxellensis]|nr:hypothetical protein HII13_003754 [Brettanomyces bruxellensis]
MTDNEKLERVLDFPSLIAKNPNLAQYYNQRLNVYNFGSNDAVIELTKTLFETNLGFKVKINDSKLCPRFFNRLDYVIFIDHLLRDTLSAEAHFRKVEHEVKYVGLDIGCGQIAVYGLMCASVMKNLKCMICTDIDDESIKTATANISRNELSDKLIVRHVDRSRNSFASLAEMLTDADADKTAAFSMCNPPFYSSCAEMSCKNAFKRQKTNSMGEYVTGTENELLTNGGELAFIRKLVQDSKNVSNKHSVIWFTSLAGNYKTVKTLVQNDFAQDPDFNFGVHSFVSGNSRNATKRWIIYWSFRLTRPPIGVSKTNLVGSRYEFTVRCGLSIRIHEDDLTNLNDIKCKRINADVLLVHFPGDRWSRAYRRSLKHINNVTQQNDDCWFRIENRSSHIVIYWLYGTRHKLFESFCGFLRRLIQSKEC